MRPETLTDGAGGGIVEDESEDLHLGTAEGAQQRVDLVDAVDRQAQLSRVFRVNPSSSCPRVAWAMSRPGAALRRLPRVAFA